MISNYKYLPSSTARAFQSFPKSPEFNNFAALLTQLGRVGKCFSILPRLSAREIAGKTGPVKPCRKRR